MDGQVVTATIATYPDDEAPQVMTGAVNEVIGDKDEPGIDILSVIYAHDVPHEFPQEVMDEANKIPLKVLPEEKKGRVDITDQPLVTIDAIESKDLDDAVVAWKMDTVTIILEFISLMLATTLSQDPLLIRKHLSGELQFT